MPTTSDIWTVTPAATWTTSIRAGLDAAIGLELDYTGTIDGAWTFQMGQLAYQVEQRVGEALAGSLLASAPRPVVVARARDRGLTPRAATSSTMVLTVATGAGGYLPVGTVLRVRSGTVEILDTAAGGITVALDSTWTVTENTADAAYVEIANTVVATCDEPGRVSIDGTVTFAPATPITGVGTLTGTAIQTFGRDAESLPELRARLGIPAVPGGSPAGIVSAIRDLPWVVAVGVEFTPGYVRVIVAPEPPTSTEALELAETIYRVTAGGTLPLGDEEVVVEGADGRDFTVRYDVGATEGVTVAFTVTPASGVTSADARVTARAAIEAEFGRLIPGDPIRYLRVIGALNQPGIVGGSVTLNGLTVDVLPTTAADLLVPVFS